MKKLSPSTKSSLPYFCRNRIPLITSRLPHQKPLRYKQSKSNFKHQNYPKRSTSKKLPIDAFQGSTRSKHSTGHPKTVSQEFPHENIYQTHYPKRTNATKCHKGTLDNQNKLELAPTVRITKEETYGRIRYHPTRASSPPPQPGHKWAIRPP